MIRAKVVHTWLTLSRRQRNELRRLANRARDAGSRCRCKVILALVRGTSPTMIARGGLCAKSQVYRVAVRFLTGGLAGLADRREDNGRPKITPAYQAELLRLVEGAPQGFGYRRPTWTQELLARVLAERVEIAISTAAMSRLLGRLEPAGSDNSHSIPVPTRRDGAGGPCCPLETDGPDLAWAPSLRGRQPPEAIPPEGQRAARTGWNPGTEGCRGVGYHGRGSRSRMRQGEVRPRAFASSP